MATLLLVTVWMPLPHSLVAQAPSPQPVPTAAPAPAGAVIRGRVLRADNGDPLQGARVEVSQVCGQGRGATPCASTVLPQLTTGADGRFEHRDVAAGSYRLTVALGGYVTQGGAVGPAIAPVDVRPGTPVEVTTALTRSAVVAGRVVDDRGHEIERARVSLKRWQWQNGKRLLTAGSPVADETDDRGQFRLFGIPAGTYLLVAETVNPAGPEPVTAYYPDTTSVSQAQPLTVRPGDELAGLTISLSRAPTSSVFGIVRRADGKPLTGGGVALIPVDRLGERDGASTMVNKDGSFAFSGVRAGEYVISAGVSDSPQLRAWEQITLNGADMVVPVTLSEGNAIRGRFVYEGAAPVPVVRPRFVSSGAIAESDAARPPSSVDGAEDGTFEIAGLNGRYRLMPSAPAGYGVKRITLRGVDVTDTALEVSGQDVEGVEVLLTQRMTRVSGTVAGVTGRREAAAVVIFPEDQSKLWPRTRYLRMARLETRDAFSVTDMPPGRYLAIAVAEHETGEESNPELLQRFRPAATPFTLEEGESRVLNLSMAVP